MRLLLREANNYSTSNENQKEMHVKVMDVIFGNVMCSLVYIRDVT